MKLRVVKLEIIDYDNGGTILHECDLVNPDMKKLAELKEMIENRFEYMYEDGLSDEDIRKAEEFRDFIWDKVHEFIAENFVVLKTDQTYEISY